MSEYDAVKKGRLILKGEKPKFVSSKIFSGIYTIYIKMFRIFTTCT